MEVQLVKTTLYWRDLLTNAVNAGTATLTLLSAAKLGAGTTVLTPNPTTVIADLGETTFIGYAESATIVWGLPVNETDGSVTSISPAHLFRCTTGGAEQAINNVFVTDGVASPNQGILASAIVSPAIGITNIGDGFSVVIAWNEGVASVNSEGTIVS